MKNAYYCTTTGLIYLCDVPFTYDMLERALKLLTNKSTGQFVIKTETITIKDKMTNNEVVLNMTLLNELISFSNEYKLAYDSDFKDDTEDGKTYDQWNQETHGY